MTDPSCVTENTQIYFAQWVWVVDGSCLLPLRDLKEPVTSVLQRIGEVPSHTDFVMPEKNQKKQAPDDNLSTPGDTEITAQLNRIVNSREFITSRRLIDFLRFVTERTLAGDTRSIKQYTIGVEVYDRDASFDPKSEPLIRIEASRLRRVLDKYYKGSGKTDPVYIEIPRGTYVPRFSYIQVFRGRFSLPSETSSEVSPGPLKKPVVAVFPLENLGEDQHKYLINGIGEELTAEFSRCPDIRVIAFCSTVQSSWQSKGIRESALELGANFALTGHMRRSGERIRISVNLLDVSTGEQIWSERFDEDFHPLQLFDIEDRVVRTVLAKVADTYGIIPRLMGLQAECRRVSEPSAFEAIMHHYHYQLTLTPEAFQTSKNALEQAVKVESSSAALWGMLGSLYLDSDVFGYADIPGAVETGVRLAGKAVSLNPDCQYAQFTKAYAGMIERDRAAMTAAAERIIAINPNAAYMCGAAGFWMCLAGEYEGGITLFKRGVELNPLYPSWLHAAPYFYYLHNRDLEKALHHANEFGLPEFFWGPIMRAAALGLIKRTKEANAAYKQVLSLKPDFSGREEDYVRVFVLDDRLVDMMLSGLRTAA